MSDGGDSETGKRNVLIQKQHDPATMLVGVSAPVGAQALINSIKKKKYNKCNEFKQSRVLIWCPDLKYFQAHGGQNTRDKVQLRV